MNDARMHDPTDADENWERPKGDTHHAFAGALMLVIALLLVGAIITRTPPNAATDTPAAGVSPSSRAPARRAHAKPPVKAVTTVKKRPRTPSSTAAVARVPTTTTVATPTTNRAPVVQVRTRTRTPGTQAPVQTAVTPTPTTQPQVAVPYSPPTSEPPDSVAVPFSSTSVPNG